MHAWMVLTEGFFEDCYQQYTEAVTSYISFCEDCCIPTRTRVSYNNDKPWFTVTLRQVGKGKNIQEWGHGQI